MSIQYSIEISPSNQPQPHTDHPDICQRLWHHQHSDHWFFFCPEHHGEIAGKADQDCDGNPPKAIAARIAGQEEQDCQAQPGHSKGQVSIDAPPVAALCVEPIILRKQAQDNPNCRADPCQRKQPCRIKNFREYCFSDIEQQHIKYRHGDRGNHKSKAGPPFILGRVSPKGLDNSRNKVKRVSASEN